MIRLANGGTIKFVGSDDGDPLRGTSIGPELMWSMALIEQDLLALKALGLIKEVTI